jgi:hypothetical protein
MLKLFVAVGKIRNATIVTSEPDDLKKKKLNESFVNNILL